MDERVFVMLLAAAAGGAGAAARYLVDGAITQWLARRVQGSPFPYGTWAVNLSGSLLIGVLAGAAAPLHPFAAVLGVGLLGGYTTFSAASYETVRLLRRGRPLAGLLNGVGQLVCAALAAVAGFGLGSLFAF